MKAPVADLLPSDPGILADRRSTNFEFVPDSMDRPLSDGDSSRQSPSILAPVRVINLVPYTVFAEALF